MKKKAIMSKLLIGFMIGTMMLTTVGCQKSAENSAETQETAKEKSESGVHDIQLTFAKNFSIKYLADGMKVVTDAQNRQVLLLKEGQSAPEAYKDLTQITIPLTKSIYTSTTQVGFLRAFEDEKLFDSIVGVRQTAESWDFDAMKNRMKEGKIVDIGSNTSMNVTYDHEIIQSLQANLIFLSGGGMGSDQEKLVGMLDQNKMAYLYDGSSSEEDYRGTMEWIKFYAAFYDLDAEAETYYNQAIARIDQVMEKVKDAPKPKVGWGIVAMGKVYVEDAGSKTAKMVRAAGADYLFDGIGDKTNSVTNISVEEFYDLLSKGDLLINRGMPKYGPDKKSIIEQAPSLGELSIFKDDKVWQITDNFWDSYHTIDQKYLELAAIFHPELFPNVEFKNFILMPDEAPVKK